jgi:hypothetical protein
MPLLGGLVASHCLHAALPWLCGENLQNVLILAIFSLEVKHFLPEA